MEFQCPVCGITAEFSDEVVTAPGILMSAFREQHRHTPEEMAAYYEHERKSQAAYRGEVQPDERTMGDE